MKPDVLILTYFFPPMGGAGTQRFAKFTKYLPEFGIKPVVVTTDGGSTEFSPTTDESLLCDVPGAARVERVATDDTLPFTDRVSGWMSKAIDRAEQVGREEDVGAIVVTCSPFELAEAGRELSDRLGVPWVLDLRDPWVLDGWMAYRTRWHWNREMARMRRAFLSADRVISTTPDVSDAFARAAPEAATSKFVSITNGWDASDFESPEPPQDPGARKGSMLIVHTGSFQSKALYPSTGPVAKLKEMLRHRPEPIVAVGRTPYYLAQGLRLLKKNDPALAERVHVKLVGTLDPFTERCIKDAGVESHFSSTGYVSHTESVGWLAAADALFLPLHGLPEGHRSLIVPGKTYEYLASGKPILGLLPEGDCRDWLAESGQGVLGPACDVEGAASALKGLTERWLTGDLPEPNRPFAAQFERRHLTERLAEILNSLGVGPAQVDDEDHPELSVLIVSYNTKDMTLECLESLQQQTPELIFETIVVDNASSDGSADAIEASGLPVKLVRLGDNVGFACGNNVAAQHARGRKLLLLNPDTVVLDRAVEKLAKFSNVEPDRGIWGGRTVYADRSLNPASCWGRVTHWSLISQVLGLSSIFRNSTLFNPEGYGGWKRDTVREVDIVSGCFFLIDRHLWDRLGGFDQRFFMYGEEADLCHRARAIGARPAVTPDATIVHYGGASERVHTDKQIRLLTAKTDLIRRHLRPLPELGVRVLTLWPLTRALAWALAGPVRRGREGESERRKSWWNIWSRRDAWLAHRDPAPYPRSRAISRS